MNHTNISKSQSQSSHELPPEVNDRLLNYFFERSSAGVWYWDLSSDKQWWSPQFRELIAYSEAELPASNEAWSSLIHPDEHDAIVKLAKDHCLNGESYDTEYRLRTGDNGYRWFHAYGGSQLDSEGQPVFMVGSISDITERKQAERLLQQSEKKYRQLVEDTNVLSWEADIDTVQFTYMSPQAEAITGYTAEQWCSPDFWEERIHEEDRERTLLYCQKYTARLEDHDFEYRLIKANGDVIWIHDSVKIPLDEAGKPLMLRGVMIDITERKHLEEELGKVQKLESIGNLAGGIAHDFNNMLTMMFGNISLAKSTLSKTHASFANLEKAEEVFQRATNLTNQLLTFAKGGEPIRENICLKQLAEEIVSFDLSGSNVKAEFSAVEKLSAADVDKGQMEQVFSNLVSNAKQAMPDGGHIFISFENAEIVKAAPAGLSPGKYVKVTLRDEGKGIKPNDLESVFDPYFSTRESGRGLGLATVFSIVNRHGGSISASSKIGVGTTFTMYLPAAEANQLEADKPAAESESPKQRPRILFVDDEEMICELAVAMFGSDGYQTETADDGEQAIEMYRQSMDAGRPYDCVILDLTIPGGIGGKEAIKDILNLDPDATALVTSGYAADPVMANYSSYGFKGVIPKPFTRKHLLEVVKKALDK